MINCPKCGAPLSPRKNQCDRCGRDVTIYKKVIYASNMCYNDGLAKAKVRDLSGAVQILKKSLELYKKNTNARNLLGLVYFEMGETVSALGEWVISKHFQPENNDADAYMEEIQSNPTQLDTANQAIKKYNSALLSAKQGNEDLAMIQLKKVTSINPKFIRAHQLLALLYMKSGENEKAKKYLLKAAKIDVSNTLTLKYLKELGVSVDRSKTSDGREVRHMGRTETTDAFMPVSTYKEDKPNIFVFINLVLGVVIGVLVTFFLIVPTVRNNVRDQYKQKTVEYNDKISVQNVTISTLEREKKELQTKADNLQKEIDSMSLPSGDESVYDSLFEGIQLYISGSKSEAAAKVAGVKEENLDNDKAKEILKKIKEDTFSGAAKELYEKGHRQYLSGKYEDALKTLQSVLDIDAENVDAMYFLGRTYQQIGDNEKAKEYYNKIIENYPDSSRAAEAKGRVRGIQ